MCKQILKQFGNLTSLDRVATFVALAAMASSPIGNCQTQSTEEKAREKLDAGQSFAAYQLVRDTKSDTGLAILEKAGKCLALEHMMSAEKFLRDGYPANALLQSELTRTYDRYNPFVRPNYKPAYAAIAKRSKYTVGIVYVPNEEDPESSRRLEKMALEKMRSLNLENVEILDRGSVESILRQQSVDLYRLGEERFQLSNDRFKGLDALIVGTVDKSRIAKDRTERKGSTRFKDGSDTKPNPRHAELMGQLQEAQQALAKAQQDAAAAAVAGNLGGMVAQQAFGGLGGLLAGAMTKQVVSSGANNNVQVAQQKVNTLNSQLAGTSETMQVDRYVTEDYPIFTHTVTVEMKSSLKLLDALTASTLESTQLQTTSEAKGEQIEGNSHKNIKEKSLELPDNATLREQACKKAEADLDRWLTSTLRKNGDRFLQAADKANSAGNRKDAVEHAFNYLMVYGDSASQGQKAFNVIEEAMGPEKEILPAATAVRQILQAGTPTKR